MCPPQVAAFVAASLGALNVAGRAVLEVGSGDPHRVVRGIVAAHDPRGHVRVGLVPGPGVDAACRAGEAHRRFGPAPSTW